jgi:nucleoside-diphosphate-sugar epimerase
MNEIDFLAVSKYLDKLSTYLPIKKYSGAEILISGASGQLGIWTVLHFMKARSEVPDINLVIESKFPKKVFDILDSAGLPRPEVINDSTPRKHDYVFDFGLPNLDTNGRESLQSIYGFVSRFQRAESYTKPGGVLVIPSSGAVYGLPRSQKNGLREEALIDPDTLTDYGAAKRIVEEMSRRIADIRTPILRVFSVFGPFSRPDSPLIGHTFFQEGRRGEISLRSGGSAIRNMTFIGDLTGQIIELSEKSITSTAPINLGSGNNISVKDFALNVAQEFDAKVIYSSDLDQLDNYVPDVTRLSEISSIPLLTLSEGIKMTKGFY